MSCDIMTYSSKNKIELWICWTLLHVSKCCAIQMFRIRFNLKKNKIGKKISGPRGFDLSRLGLLGGHRCSNPSNPLVYQDLLAKLVYVIEKRELHVINSWHHYLKPLCSKRTPILSLSLSPKESILQMENMYWSIQWPLFKILIAN